MRKAEKTQNYSRRIIRMTETEKVRINSLKQGIGSIYLNTATTTTNIYK